MSSPRSIPCPKCGRIYTNGEQICPHDKTPLVAVAAPPATDPFINTIIDGRYTVIDRLGAGGMGVVYRALQNRLDRHVALKVLSVRVGDDPGAADRFRNEALAASRLTNAHTVIVHEFGATEDGALYIAMQLLEGESLRHRLKRGPLSLREALIVAEHICESLAEAHEWTPPIIHRDIKPDNIFVKETSRGILHATVLDFGLARFADLHRTRLTSANQAIGTPAYMSPEQCRGSQEIDGRSDLYALGAVLFEMITGQPPFNAPDPPSLLFKHVYDTPPRLRDVRPDEEIPESVEALVAELLAKAPANRPASAANVRDRLLELIERLPRLTPVAAHLASTTTQPMRALPVDSGSRSPAKPQPTLTGFESVLAPSLPRAGTEVRSATAVAITAPQASVSMELPAPPRRPLAIPIATALIAIGVVAGLVTLHQYVKSEDAPVAPAAVPVAAAPIPTPPVEAPPPPPAPVPVVAAAPPPAPVVPAADLKPVRTVSHKAHKPASGHHLIQNFDIN